MTKDMAGTDRVEVITMVTGTDRVEVIAMVTGTDRVEVIAMVTGIGVLVMIVGGISTKMKRKQVSCNAQPDKLFIKSPCDWNPPMQTNTSSYILSRPSC